MINQLKPAKLLLSIGLLVSLGACGAPRINSGEGGEESGENTEITTDEDRETGEEGEED